MAKTVTVTDRELLALQMQWAANCLQSLIDETCNDCKGKDVREAMAARKRKLEQQIEEIDRYGKVN